MDSPTLWLLPIFFLLAASSDWCTCRWLKAREEGKVWKAVALSAVLESLTWIPILAAIEYRDPVVIALACIVGSVFGTGFGLRRHKPSLAYSPPSSSPPPTSS